MFTIITGMLHLWQTYECNTDPIIIPFQKQQLPSEPCPLFIAFPHILIILRFLYRLETLLLIAILYIGNKNTSITYQVISNIFSSYICNILFYIIERFHVAASNQILQRQRLTRLTCVVNFHSVQCGLPLAF